MAPTNKKVVTPARKDSSGKPPVGKKSPPPVRKPVPDLPPEDELEEDEIEDLETDDEEEETPAPVRSGSKWANLLDELNSGGNGNFFFPKNGRTRIRLVPESGTDEHFYAEAVSSFRGQNKTKYIILGVVLGTDQGELDEKWKDKVVGIIVPKLVMKGIAQLLVEEYDLLSDEGHGITVIRSGSGQFDTTYSVVPSQKPVLIDWDVVTMAEMTLDEMAAEFEEFQANRSNASSNDDEETPKRKGKGKRQESDGEGW